MAKHGPFANAYLTVNGVNLSDHVKSLTLNTGANLNDETAMGDNTVINRASTKTWDLSVEFFQDFAANSVDATLNPLVGAAAFPVAMRPDSTAAMGATNPCWSGLAVLQGYQPLGGAKGDELMAPVSFASAGNLTRTAA